MCKEVQNSVTLWECISQIELKRGFELFFTCCIIFTKIVSELQKVGSFYGKFVPLLVCIKSLP